MTTQLSRYHGKARSIKKRVMSDRIVSDQTPGSIRLLCTDFDGTLFDHTSSPCIPMELLKHIAELQRQGCLWVVNTGREKDYLLESLTPHGNGVQPDYLATVERELHYLQRGQYEPVIAWNNHVEQVHEALFLEHRDLLNEIGEWIKSNFDAQVYADPFSPVCLIANSVNDALAIKRKVIDMIDPTGPLAWVCNDIYARFSHSAIHKGSVLAEVARRHSIAPNQIVAAGDHFNDLPMLKRQYAQHLIVPCNGMQEVIEAVSREKGFVASSPAGAGLMQGLSRLDSLGYRATQ